MSWLIRWCAPKQKLDPYDNQDAGERVVDLAFAPPIEVPAEVDETYASSAVDRPETRVAPLWSPRNASPARDVRTVSPEAAGAAARVVAAPAEAKLPLATPRRDGPAAHLRRPSHALLNGFRGAARAYATGRRGALSKQPVNPDELEVLREVGRGAFGRVYLARVRGGGGALFAVKVLRKSSVLAAGGAESVFTERDVARSAKHGFVAQLRCAFQSRLALYLVSDFYPGGSLAELLKRTVRLSGAPLPLDDVRFYAAELSVALSYLHSVGVVHRDLKPANVLLDRDGHVAVSDFGLARAARAGLAERRGPQKSSKVRGFCGTVAYMAPELLRAGEQHYGPPCDWWAYACSVQELATGSTPFEAASSRALFRNILKGDPRAVGDADLGALLSSLLRRDPDVRGGARAIARSHFFRQLSWRDVERKRLHPPRAPPLPPFLETRADGELAFVSEPSTARTRELGSPRRVTFDEENLTPSKLNQSKADIKASRKRFQGFAFDSKVDLAASPATYRAAGGAY